MRSCMLKSWSIRTVENHCLSTLITLSTRMLLLSGFNPPRRCCLPLVVSPLIWSWKGECCQDSNNVMIMGTEEKANTFLFLVGCSFSCFFCIEGKHFICKCHSLKMFKIISKSINILLKILHRLSKSPHSLCRIYFWHYKCMCLEKHRVIQ